MIKDVPEPAKNILADHIKKEHGVESYELCEREEFGIESYNECEILKTKTELDIYLASIENNIDFIGATLINREAVPRH